MSPQVFAASDFAIPEPADLYLVEEPLLLKAIADAKAAVQRSPDVADMWGALGHVYLSHGWEAPAIPCYRQASRLAPTEFKWSYFLGRLTQQEPEDAVKHLKRAIALNSEYAPAHLYLASALRTLGRFDEAQQHLARAKHLQPNNPFSELWLGEIALVKQQIKLARTHLELALRLNPQQSEAHALMAQVAIALREPGLAKQHAEAARQPSQYTELKDPLWWEVLRAGVTAPLYAERGRRYLSAGNYSGAVAEFAQLISHAQKDVELWLDYGIALLHTERYSEAVAALESASTLLRSDADIQKEKKQEEIDYLAAQVYYYLGQIYYETGRTEAAIHTCQKALQRSENLLPKSNTSGGQHNSHYFTLFSNVHANLAMVYTDTNQLDEAITEYRKALELLPTKPSLHRDIARVYWKQRRYTEAEPHYKRVVQNDPTATQAVYRLGLIALANGRYTQAVSELEKVIELDPKHTQAYGALGIAYQKLRDLPAAIRALEKVLQLDPGNKNALQILDQIHKSK